MSPISDIEELPRPTPQVLKFLARPSKQARSGYVDLSKFPNIQLEILSLSIYRILQLRLIGQTILSKM